MAPLLFKDSAVVPESKLLYIKEISHILLRRTKSDWALKGIRHVDWCVLVCCVEGCAEYRFIDSDLQVKAGDVLFFAQNEERSVRSNWKNPWSFYTAVFSLHEDLGVSGKELGNLLGRNPLRSTKEIVAKFSDLSLQWAERKIGYELRCVGMLLELLGSLLEEANDRALSTRIPNYSRIKKVMVMIEHSSGKDLRIGKIAAEAGLSESRFRHLFKEATGSSPTRYANLKKVQKAKDLLLSGSFNVGEAAEELGFQNIFYFSRLFKSITGQNPSVYLKK